MLWIQKDLVNNLIEDFREFIEIIFRSEFVQAFQRDLLAPIGPLFLLLLLSGNLQFFFGVLLSYITVVITLSFSNKGKLLLPDSTEVLDEYQSVSLGLSQNSPEFISSDDNETVEWINVWLRTIWKVQKKTIEKKIMDSVSGIMDAVNPIKMVNLEIPEVELGSNPPFIEKIKSYRQTPSKEIHADFELTLDEPDARIKIAAGEKITFPVVLSNLKFSGNVHLEMKLTKATKVVEEVRLSFFEAPQVSFDLKPMHSVNIMQVPLVSTWLRHLIFSVLAEFLVSPNMIVIPIESIEITTGKVTRGIASLIPPKPKEFSAGIAKITVLEASEIPRPDRLGTCNPYIAISIEGGPGTQFTQVKRQDFNPSWNEHFFFPVMDPCSQQVSISLYDESSHHSDELVERWLVSVLPEGPLLLDCLPTLRELILNFPSKSGFVKCMMEQRSVLSSCDLSFSIPSGLVHVTIHCGQQLKSAKTVHVSVYFGREWELYRTQTATHAPRNPTWDEQFEFVAEDITQEMLHFVVSDSRTGTLLGEHKLRLHEFLNGLPFQNRVWLELWNVERGRLCISLEWRPIDLSVFQVFDAISSKSEGPLQVSQSMNFQNNEGEGLSRREIKEKEKYVTSVSRGSFAKVLVSIHRAKELSDLLMGKSHPYVVVRSGSIKYFKTTTKKKTLDPIWEETFPIPISFESSTNPLLIFEIKDDDILGMARSLGSVEVPLQPLKDAPDEPINGSFPILKGGYQKGWLELTIICEKVKARSSISKEASDLPLLFRRGSQASALSSPAQVFNGAAPLPAPPPIACGRSSSFFPTEQTE